MDMIVDGIEELSSLDSIPVRKAPILDSWDQYLLYGIRSGKRGQPSFSTDPNTCNEGKDPLPLSGMCLTEEELLANNYMVVKSEGMFLLQCE